MWPDMYSARSPAVAVKWWPARSLREARPLDTEQLARSTPELRDVTCSHQLAWTPRLERPGVAHSGERPTRECPAEYPRYRLSRYIFDEDERVASSGNGRQGLEDFLQTHLRPEMRIL